MRKLADSQKVKAGTTVWLETVPVPLLRVALLVQGEWLDRYVVELAEWGALTQARGCSFKENWDDHPLALARLVKGEKRETDEDELKAIRRQGVAGLTKLTGKVKQIDGRPYLRFEDYCAWKGRKVKGDLKAGVQQGVLTDSWNEWVASCGDQASVAGVPVAGLQCDADWYSRWTPDDGLDEELRRRQQMVDDLRKWSKNDGKAGEMIEDWKQAAEGSLVELLVFREAVAQIEKRYVDGLTLLFPDVARSLSEVVDGTETLVGIYNDLLAKHDQAVPVDLEAVRCSASKLVASKTTYLVDMAKADALEEMGDREASIELAGRYF